MEDIIAIVIFLLVAGIGKALTGSNSKQKGDKATGNSNTPTPTPTPPPLPAETQQVPPKYRIPSVEQDDLLPQIFDDLIGLDDDKESASVLENTTATATSAASPPPLPDVMATTPAPPEAPQSSTHKIRSNTRHLSRLSIHGRNRRNLRQAIVLSEALGRPRAFDI